MPRPPYLTKPRWLVGHVIVVAVAVLFVNLGFWQLRRLDERRHHNAVVLSRSANLSPLTTGRPLPYRRVLAVGTYDPGHELLVRFRSRNGLPGYEVVTPLVTKDGPVVLVDRGWVPLDAGDHWPVASAGAPTGDVAVIGLLAPGEGGGLRLERRAGRTPVIGSIDVPALEAAKAVPGGDVYPLHLVAETTTPEVRGNYPAPVEPPDLGLGPHLSYAFQWFAFATVGVIGWIVLLARRASKPEPEPEPEPE
jgi:cytochrome oxidase assembly protein ShyY1